MFQTLLTNNRAEPNAWRESLCDFYAFPILPKIISKNR